MSCALLPEFMHYDARQSWHNFSGSQTGASHHGAETRREEVGRTSMVLGRPTILGQRGAGPGLEVLQQNPEKNVT